MTKSISTEELERLIAKFREIADQIYDIGLSVNSAGWDPVRAVELGIELIGESTELEMAIGDLGRAAK